MVKSIIGLIGDDIIQENLKILSPSWSYYSTYGFHVAGKAKKASEVTEEFLDITGKVLKVVEGFFIPTGFKSTVFSYYHDDSPLNIFKCERSSSSDVQKVSVDNSVFFDTLKREINSIETPNNQIKLIYKIDLNGRTKFILEDGERFVDGVTQTFIGPENKKINELQTLFWITISHPEYIVNEAAGLDAPAYYLVNFETIIRAYGDDSSIGKANRNLLRSVFKKFCATFDVYDTLFWSDWEGEEYLKFIAFGEDEYTGK